MASSGGPRTAADREDAKEPPGEPSATLCAAEAPKDSPTLVTVVGAVASGLGVLGFVTFAGGVVLWTRFKHMGLPADHALGLVPKAELVATGAEFLVPAVVLSALIVLVTVLVSSLPIGPLANRLSPGEDIPDWASGDAPQRRRGARKAIAPVIVGIAGVLFAIAALKSTIPFYAFAVLVGVSLLGALVVHACAERPLPVFCLVAFLAVGTFAIARTYERTSHRLEVLPMAYSRSQPGEAPRVETGYFVAETSDRIIFASVPEASEVPNELREFPRSETDDLEVGELALPEQAKKNAARFAYNLCERLAHLRPAAAPAGKLHPVCPEAYMRELATTAELKVPSPAGR